jgi:hypothetical protein
MRDASESLRITRREVAGGIISEPQKRNRRKFLEKADSVALKF